MPSRLVDDVRALLNARIEDIPLTPPERALLIASIGLPGGWRETHGSDLVTEVQTALANVRTVVDPKTLQPDHAVAIGRLLAAVVALLEFEPPPPDPPAPLLPPAPDARPRADTDN